MSACRVLRRDGLWDVAVIVFLSDHGEGLGEHGVDNHGYVWHEQLHVPLMIRVPGVPPRRIGAPVSLVDALPTAFALSGTRVMSGFLEQASGMSRLDPDGAAGAAGRVFSIRSGHRRVESVGPAWALTTPRWRFIRRPEDGDLLFDRGSDALELENVLGSHPRAGPRDDDRNPGDNRRLRGASDRVRWRSRLRECPRRHDEEAAGVARLRRVSPARISERG